MLGKAEGGEKGGMEVGGQGGAREEPGVPGRSGRCHLQESPRPLLTRPSAAAAEAASGNGQIFNTLFSILLKTHINECCFFSNLFISFYLIYCHQCLLILCEFIFISMCQLISLFAGSPSIYLLAHQSIDVLPEPGLRLGTSRSRFSYRRWTRSRQVLGQGW